MKLEWPPGNLKPCEIGERDDRENDSFLALFHMTQGFEISKLPIRIFLPETIGWSCLFSVS